MPSVTEQIVGYFIIETHVLNTTGSFRSEREVEDLWDALISRLSNAVEDVLRNENDPDTYLKVKEALLGFVMTLEVCVSCLCVVTVGSLKRSIQSYSYSTTKLHTFIMMLFEKYVTLLERQFGRRFEVVSMQQNYLPAVIAPDFFPYRLSHKTNFCPCMLKMRTNEIACLTQCGCITTREII